MVRNREGGELPALRFATPCGMSLHSAAAAGSADLGRRTTSGEPCVLVSGLPRSGTSLLMQMLAAGGLPALSDGLRAPDAANPRGYLEWEPIKRIRERPELLEQARGHAVKVVSALLRDLPAGRRYRVLFAIRALTEVQASQLELMRRLGAEDDGVGEAELQGHLDEVRTWLRGRPGFETCYIDYAEALRAPRATASRIRAFLGLELDVEAMAAAVDPLLYRQRGG